MFISNQNNPNQNRVFIFANDCGLCGENKFQDIINIIRKYKKEPVVKTISLFNGWKREAQILSKKFEVEVPFIFDFNNQIAIGLEEARKDNSKLEEILK